MHPLAHMLTGAVIGEVAPSPTTAFFGGLLSHFVLDAIPHAEGETFKEQPSSGFGAEFIEAGLEFFAGVLIVGWVASTCHAVKPLSVGLGTLAALLPDFIDLPLKMFFGITILHARGLHWTVKRRNAIWGILTQVAVAGGAAAYLWRASGCGL